MLSARMRENFKMRSFTRFFCFYLLFTSVSFGQDSLYTRKVLKKLCSKEFFGRGYRKNGLGKASEFIKDELERSKALPLFNTGYFQWFDFNVNTFPGKPVLKINGKLLQAGSGYIVSPESRGIKGKFKVEKKDSVTYVAGADNLIISLQRKLTFSVATKAADYTVVELLNRDNFNDIKTIDISLENKVLNKYLNKNVCAYIKGTVNNDSMVVLTAHYDHLGGLGDKVYFPGANDNASGVSMLLNLVKYYAKNPPKYKTVFIFFAGEEAGLLGSKYFTENNNIDLTKIKFLINLDLLGTGEEGITVVNATIFKPQFDLLKRINAEKNYLPFIKPRDKAHNSDHYWFTEKGVPSFFIYTMGGIKAYHDIYDKPETLPLTKYREVYHLLIDFISFI